MKPIYIKMKAFGSYQQEIIDFTDVNRGLFLITGDTGAGKTTIFDAITYALYGKTSGGKRNGEMMCSQFAPAGMLTEVEFRFLYNDSEYTVCRRPEQPKWKKTEKDGTGYYKQLKTMPPAFVELTLPDGTVWQGKKRETDRKIEEIIGLNVEQFTQIAMLAQGEFMKLLHATSEERKEIFSRIFDTGLYARIEKKISEHAKAVNQRLDENKQDILRELERIRCVENSSYQQAWDSYEEKFSESDKEGLLKLISDICLEGEKKKGETEETKKKMESQLEAVKRELQFAEMTNGIFTQLEETEKQQQELEAELPRIKESEEKLKKGQRAAEVRKDYQNLQEKKETLENCKFRITELEQWMEKNLPELEILKGWAREAAEKYENQSPELHGAIADLRGNLERYDELENRKVKYVEIKTEFQKAQNKVKELEQNRETCKRELEELSAATEEIKKSTENMEVLDERTEKERNRKERLEDIRSYLSELERQERELKESQDIYEAASREEETKQAEYDDIYHRFIESQAFILRSGLKDGEPCPVCGSIHHVILEDRRMEKIDSVDEKMLRKAKTELDRAAKDKLRADKCRQKNEMDVENTGRLLEYEYRKQYGTELILSENTAEEIESDYQEVKKAIEELENRRKTAEQNIKILEENEKRLKEITAGSEKLTEDLKERQGEMNRSELQMAECGAGLNQLKETLRYPDKEQAEKILKEKEDEIAGLKKMKEKMEKEFQQFEQTVNEKKGKLDSERESLLRDKAGFYSAEDIYEKNLKEQGFESTEAFINAVLSGEEVQKLKDTIQKFKDKELLVHNNLERLRREADGKEKIDTSGNQIKQQDLEDRLKTLEREEKELFNMDKINQTAYQNGKKLYSQRETWKEQTAVIDILNKTANGGISKKRMNFQTYIQRRYFCQIIKYANQRLYPMSGGQFILQCREIEDLGTQGTVGLDLDVYSIVNDRTRDVKTLSGGESFMAALSMALGMADIIQNNLGSIHIDTMFIDEGFGTLSDETRNQAIQILNELSGGKRLVGIISHVSELKAQVETKLTVTKTAHGSRARWEFI